VVEAIRAEFGITQAVVSQHLKVLRESGFARVRADAQRRLYSVDALGLQAVFAWVGKFRSLWEPKLDALATEIARGKRARRGAPTVGRRRAGVDRPARSIRIWLRANESLLEWLPDLHEDNDLHIVG
jgi:hypothetical protein